MKEWKAPEKETQKMTRDGAISVNMVTGEVSRTSNRAAEADYSPTNDSTAFIHTAAEHLDDRRIHKSEKKKRKNRRKSYREEQSILILHFVLNLPDQEIGRLVGMSRSAVQRHRTKSLSELRIKLAALMPKGG